GMAQIEPASGRFLRVNARLCDMTGYDADDLIGRRIADLAEPGSQAGLSSVDTPFSLNQEAWLRRSDGHTICVAINPSLIHDQQGRPRHAVVTLDDGTENKVRDGQITQLNNELSHLARGNMMGQMAAGLAHELNQPLAAIVQNAETARL